MNPRSARSTYAPAASAVRLHALAILRVSALALVAAFVLSCFAFSLGSQSRAFAFSWSKPTNDASNPIAPTIPVAGSMVAGNYCTSCHDTTDARLTHAADWRGSPALTPSSCPGLQAEDEQLYYVERQLLALTRLDPNAPGLTSLYDGYGALLAAPRASTDAFAAQSQLLAYKAGKTYAAVNTQVESGKRLRVLIAALLVTAFLLFAFGWGLRNTLRYQPAKTVLKAWRPGPRTVGLLGVVVVIFALPLFRTPPSVVATPTTEDQAMQAELDKSSRAGAVAERSLGRAAMLGEVAAAWARVDRARGEQVLAEALTAEAAARADADALWGRMEAGREAAVGSLAGQDKAALIAEELLSVRNRAWALRLIASQWAAVDAPRAREILAQAEAVARANPTVYGQIDLAAIAATWARLDPGHLTDAPVISVASASAAGPIAETLALHRAGDYARAWDASLKIGDEWERARAQAAIAKAWVNADVASKISIPPLREYASRKLTEAASAEAQLPTDTDAALAIIAKRDTEAEKADALRLLAVRTGAPDIFDRALKMSAAARVRGDALAPARASLALATALLEKGGSADDIKAALAQAYDLTAKISVKYK